MNSSTTRTTSNSSNASTTESTSNPSLARTWLADAAAAWRERRETAAKLRRIEDELACYHSRSDIEDLLAAADRSEHPDAELMRSVLTGKLGPARRARLAA